MYTINAKLNRVIFNYLPLFCAIRNYKSFYFILDSLYTTSQRHCHYYIDISCDIARMTEQRGRPHSNLNGYYRARRNLNRRSASGKIRWSPVPIHGRPHNQDRSSLTGRQQQNAFRIARGCRDCSMTHKRISKDTLGVLSNHVSFVENQRERATRDGTTFLRNDIGERSVNGVDIRTDLRSQANGFFVVAGETATGTEREFSRRPVAKTRRNRRFSARSAVAKTSQRQEGRVRGAHKRVLRFATAEAVHWTRNERFAARTHTAAR